MARYTSSKHGFDAVRQRLAAPAENDLAGVGCSGQPPRSVRSCSTATRSRTGTPAAGGRRAGGLDELFSPGYRLKGLDPSAEQPRIGGDGGGDIQIAVVGGPPKRGAQVRQLDGEPV